MKFKSGLLLISINIFDSRSNIQAWISSFRLKSIHNILYKRRKADNTIFTHNKYFSNLNKSNNLD